VTNNQTSGPLLDAWRNPDTDVRIAVDYWCVQESITNQFLVRPKSVRMVWNYLRRIGPLAVWRKIRSRLAEGSRNTKVAGVGVGRVLEAPADSALGPGQQVVFFAPNHSSGWPRICLDLRLIAPMQAGSTTATESAVAEIPDTLRAYVGWSPYSGIVLDADAVQRELRRLSPWCRSLAGGAERGSAPTSLQAHGQERLEVDAARSGRMSVVLFGFGNFATTEIVTHVRRHFHLATIHELDPDLIATAGGLRATLDTSPWPREGEHYDAWFIAGFHHTHAPLAVRALQDGAVAVVEKPLATTRAQFADIQRALGGSGQRRLFTCFHKRYSRMSEWARTDLGVDLGDPIDMHCMVYEIRLPALHWYNWPNSGSRIISNGCHWLDYFLYMNHFAPVSALYVRPLRGRDLLVSVRLDNGAQFVMSLTDTGSQRIGVRDVIDLRTARTTVRLVDATYYNAENTSRLLRRRRVNPMDAYRRMYDTICSRIALGQDGDSPESLRSTALMLDLEDALRDERGLPREIGV
jgi:predicted dehydrogenase